MYLFLFNTLILVIYNIINYQPSIFRELPYGGVNPVALLMFLSITITIFLYHTNKKKIILLLIPLYLYLLFLTQSQKSILSIAIELILYTVLNLYFLNIKSSIKYFFLSVLLVFIGYYFLLEFEILEGSANRTFATIKALTSGGHVEGAAGGAVGEGLRAVVKEYGWSYFAESPFWGYGINNFRELYGRETGFYTYTHYTPLELILGMGFLALPIYYGIYYLLLRDYFKSLKKHRISTYSFVISSIIATIIVGLYMQTYFDAAIHFYLMLLYVFNKFKVKELNYHALKVHGFNN